MPKFRCSIRPLNMNREVWEGWRVKDFVGDLQPQLDVIMKGGGVVGPFENRFELRTWIKENQPYYKKRIPEVEEYFERRYAL